VVDHGELGEGAALGRVVHPRERVDVELHRGDDALEELDGILRATFRELK
jgi:hypothetical protein